MKCLLLIIESLLIINNVVRSTEMQPIDVRETMLAKYGANMSKCMDVRANPCDDFYRYACGRWHDHHKIPSGVDTISERDILTQTYVNNMHIILNAGPVFPIEESFKLVKDYYQSCIDTDILEKRDTNPIKQFLKQLGGMPYTRMEWKESTFNVTRLLIDLKKYYNIDILIGMTFSNDFRNPKETILYVGETPLSPLPRNYYFEAKHSRKVEKYRLLMLKYLQKLGVDYDNADALSKKFVELEKNILKGVLIDSAHTLRVLSLRQLTQEHLLDGNNQIGNFKTYVETVLGHTERDDTKVVEANHHYIKSVLDVMQRTPNRILASYIMYKVAELFMYENFDKNGRLVKGDSRIPFCVRQTIKYFPKVTSQLYYEKYRNSVQCSELHDIFDKLKAALKPQHGNDFDNIKIECLTYDKKEVSENLGSIEISKQEYYKNTENMMKFQANYWYRKSATIGKQDLAKPLEMNAYYLADGGSKRIYVPIVALQSPFYDSRYPKAINYARLGIYLARAMTNANTNFSHSHYSYEENYLKNWWQKDDDINSSNSFGGLADDKIKCFQDQIRFPQLASIVPEDESFAISYGVKAAFKAYLHYIGELEPKSIKTFDTLLKETLYGLNLTNTQLFFVSYAQNWCRAFKKKSTKLHWFASLANFDEFSKEFRCPEGSWMRPKHLCTGWDGRRH